MKSGNTPVILTASYFDSYDFIGQNGIPSGTATAYESVDVYGKRYAGGCRGQQTGSLTARLSKTGLVTGYLYSVMYYDDRYRMIQQKGNNELNGTEQTYTAYSFTGQPTEVKQVHVIPGKETITEIRKHTYDHADRLLRTTYQLNNDPLVTLVDNVYDEAGRLKSERRSGNSKLKTDYGYNVRSWTRSISGSLFNQTLYYQDQLEGNTPCYNGNISSMLWKASPSNNESGYRFTYDGLNRMKNAIYGEGSTLGTNVNRFNEQITAYDKMGNILGLLRYGQTSSSEYGLIDNLNLTYDGNQLQSVKDNATHSVFGNGMEFKDGANQAIEYSYDKNGNLTKDLNKNISVIQYNLLNLPSQVSFTGGNVIEYEYGADGKKLRTVHITNGVTSTTDYCGNAIYENGSLKMLLNESGYVSFPDKKFHFYLKDHLGNVRVVADKDGNVEETNGYYPFGGLFTTSTSVQPYKYNGKELDRKSGLNWYDYGARYYDPAIGRWHVVDPLCEKSYNWNPYTYCNNSPEVYFDPDGNQALTIAKSARYVSKPSRLKRMYQAIKSLIFGTAIGTEGTRIYNHFVDGDRSQEVFEALTKEVDLNSPVKTDNQIDESSTKESSETNDTETKSKKKTNPKREAREKAKAEKEKQPASEQRVKWKARELEKAEGADARRKAHDAKEKGAPDRTKKQIDEDYKK